MFDVCFERVVCRLCDNDARLQLRQEQRNEDEDEVRDYTQRTKKGQSIRTNLVNNAACKA